MDGDDAGEALPKALSPLTCGHLLAIIGLWVSGNLFPYRLAGGNFEQWARRFPLHVRPSLHAILGYLTYGQGAITASPGGEPQTSPVNTLIPVCTHWWYTTAFDHQRPSFIRGSILHDDFLSAWRFSPVGSPSAQVPAFSLAWFRTAESGLNNHLALVCSVSAHRLDRSPGPRGHPRGAEASTFGWGQTSSNVLPFTQAVWLRSSPANWGGSCRKSRTPEFRRFLVQRSHLPGWLAAQDRRRSGAHDIAHHHPWRIGCLVVIAANMYRTTSDRPFRIRGGGGFTYPPRATPSLG